MLELREAFLSRVELGDDLPGWLEFERKAFHEKEELGQDNSAGLDFASLVKKELGDELAFLVKWELEDDSPPCLEHASLEKEQLGGYSLCLEARGASLLKEGH